MSAHRTRGLLRAAALLAAGAAPLMAGTASAAEAPLDVVEGKVGEAAHRLDVGLAKPATNLVAGQALKLPTPAQSPVASAPQLPSADLPTGALPPVAQLPIGQLPIGQLPIGSLPIGSQLPLGSPEAQAREVTAPAVAKLPGAPAVPAPTVNKPAVPGLPGGAGPVTLPVLGG
ncbi:hypothetical protein ABZ816_17270 [Actinosynnema sp. NPDC047251]|uniref:Putative secreted protein n=1 Tax=Saccharothrix espanaensis (strain ATCC 51144 / DSM 44229 / JCM 9112 / NBRC 15066 / NRRL 15764) TaxID=1179773 RepID=K0JYF6_SACES|nr:hypothetical protein [Saccharothrix espanaensis]CCH30352.1 putative secreted protein [Saccharothrix espanaensis DSM 44229]